MTHAVESCSFCNEPAVSDRKKGMFYVLVCAEHGKQYDAAANMSPVEWASHPDVQEAYPTLSKLILEEATLTAQQFSTRAARAITFEEKGRRYDSFRRHHAAD